jgi:hypothetical protein
LDVIAAALRIQLYDRAAGYMEKLSWPEHVTINERDQQLRPLRRLIELCTREKAGKGDVLEAVELWRAMEEDTFARRNLRYILEDVALAAIKAMESRQRSRDVGPLLVATCERSEARPYWERIISRKRGQVSGADTETIASFGSLIRAFGQLFEEPEYECLSWFEVSELAKKQKPREPLLRAIYLRLALAAAPSDWLRWRAVQGWAAEMRSAGEFAQALEVVRTTMAQVDDPELSSGLDALAYEIQRDLADDEGRVVKERAVVEQDRIHGQLRHLERQLSLFRKLKRTAEVAALERTIETLERKVTE